MIFHQFWWHFQWIKCHQFLWFFLEIFVDLLNWWHFRHTKTHQFLQITKIFTKIGEKFAENSNHQDFHKKMWKFWHIWDHIHFLLNFRQIFHQFWWKFWWFEEIGEFLSDKNVTNSGDNNSFQFWVFLSPILVKIWVIW